MSQWLAAKQVEGALGISEGKARIEMSPLRPRQKKQVGLPGKGHVWPAELVEEVMDVSQGAGIRVRDAAKVVAYLRERDDRLAAETQAQ